MSKKKVVYPVFMALLFMLAAIVMVQAAGTPGSSSDPLVTKSYVDQQIAQLSARIGSGGGSGGTVNSSAVSQLQTDVGDLTRFVIDALTDIENIKGRLATIESGFSIVQMSKGQKLILGSGSDFILRSGQATAIKGESGTLVDASAGVDLLDGANVPVQHLVITPKGDGRGIIIKSATAYLIIRGSYSVQ
jgi:hypothetical protein